MPLLKLCWLSQVIWSPPYRAYALTSVFQLPEHLCGVPLEPLQQAHVLFVLRAPDLVAVPQVGLQKSRGETVTSLTLIDGYPSFDAAEDIPLLCFKGTLSAHVKLFIHQHSQVLFC